MRIASSSGDHRERSTRRPYAYLSVGECCGRSPSRAARSAAIAIWTAMLAATESVQRRAESATARRMQIWAAEKMKRRVQRSSTRAISALKNDWRPAAGSSASRRQPRRAQASAALH
jgi:hypothetical protein